MCPYEDWLACAGIPNHINHNAPVYQVNKYSVEMPSRHVPETVVGDLRRRQAD